MNTYEYKPHDVIIIKFPNFEYTIMYKTLKKFDYFINYLKYTSPSESFLNKYSNIMVFNLNIDDMDLNTFKQLIKITKNKPINFEILNVKIFQNYFDYFAIDFSKCKFENQIDFCLILKLEDDSKYKLNLLNYIKKMITSTPAYIDYDQYTNHYSDYYGLVEYYLQYTTQIENLGNNKIKEVSNQLILFNNDYFIKSLGIYAYKLKNNINKNNLFCKIIKIVNDGPVNLQHDNMEKYIKFSLYHKIIYIDPDSSITINEVYLKNSRSSLFDITDQIKNNKITDYDIGNDHRFYDQLVIIYSINNEHA